MNKQEIIKDTLQKLKEKGLLNEDAMADFMKDNNTAAFKELAQRIAKIVYVEIDKGVQQIESAITYKNVFALKELIKILKEKV